MEDAMRDMVYQSNSSVLGTRRGPGGLIKLAGERLKDWLEARAARAAEAALYQQLSRPSDAERERRGIPRGELHRCVSGSSDGPTTRR
jgi:hypothetical protein